MLPPLSRGPRLLSAALTTSLVAAAPAAADTYHATQEGAGSACTAAAPCSLDAAIAKAHATPSTFDTVQVAGALTGGSTVDLRQSPVRLVGSGSDGGTSISVGGSVAAIVGGGSSLERVRVSGTTPRVVELDEGGRLEDVVVARSGSWAHAVTVSATASTATTVLRRVRIEQPNDGQGAGLGDRFATAGAVLDETIVEDSVITGPQSGIAWRTGRLIVRRSTIDAEENGITLSREGAPSGAAAPDVHVSSTIVRALPFVGDSGTGYFNALRVRDGASVTARHIVLDGTANKGIDPGDGHPLRDGFDIAGTASAPSSVDVRHSVIRNVYTALECVEHGRIDVSTTAFDPNNGVVAASCPVVQGTGNRLSDRDLGFVDADAGDFRLQPSSPLVDAAGTSGMSGFESATDRRGNPRLADGDGDGTAARDMGAHELPPGATPILPDDPEPEPEPTVVPGSTQPPVDEAPIVVPPGEAAPAAPRIAVAPSTSGPLALAPVLALRGRVLALRGAARDRVVVPVACPPAAGRACAVQLRLELLRGRRPLLAGRRSITVAPGATAQVTMKLNRAARRALRGRRSIPARVVLAEAAATATRRVTLRRPR